jgi:hypothetical protein
VTSTETIIVVGFLGAMVLGFGLLGYTRRLNYKRSVEDNEDDRSKSSGISKRTIRYTTVVLLIPVIGILSAVGILGPQGTSALVGAIIGYMLRGFDDEDDD